MSKYSYELKLEVVQAYHKGKGGYKHLAKEYGIPDTKPIREWVRNFEDYGEDGLKKSEKNKKYSFDFKLSVVEYYLTEIISYSELARMYKIKNHSLLARWVQDFQKHGLDGLSEKPKGRVPKMTKEPIQPTESKDVTSIAGANATQEEYIKELERKLSESEEKLAKKEQELLYSKIENDYLKEVRKLRLKQAAERTSKTAKLQESSTTSEDLTD